MVDVIAVGTAVASKFGNLAHRMEQAMVDAINKCHAEGIHDVESILEAKRVALEKIKAEIAAGE